MSLSSSKTYLHAIDVTMLAFEKEKPLFKVEEKPQAAELMQKSMPYFKEAYTTFRKGMNLEHRESAKMSRSGLQFLVDEFKDDKNVYGKLQSVIECPSVKSLEEYFKNTVGMDAEYSTPYNTDMSKIPNTHFWWYLNDSE